MQIEKSFNLSAITSFHIGGPADYFCIVQNLEELKQALEYAQKNNQKILVKGGGSNMLVSDAGFRGMVIEIDFKGITVVDEDENKVLIKVGSGEVWDDVVRFAVDKNWGNLENLSAIPGKTGAIPIQNVGAYGQEAAQTVDSVEVLDISTGETKILKNSELGFAYRKSNFNTIWKNKFIVLNINFSLSKLSNVNISYVDVKKYFENAQISNPSIAEVRIAIIEIRKKKFPDISVTGNAGSFFKNLILSENQYMILENHIKTNFSPEILQRLMEIKNKFPTKEGIKIPTAFLIDICGLKGKTLGGAKLWDIQPLVIVNTGFASASDVLNLFKEVRKEVYLKTGMEIANEPEFIGFEEQELNEAYKLHE